MQTPPFFFFIKKSRHYVTFSHWIGRDHAIELDPDHLEGEHLFTWTLLMMEQVRNNSVHT
jgi:hypothetical protein